MTEGMDVFNMRKGGKGVKIFAAAALFCAFFGYSMLILVSIRAVHGDETALLSIFVALTSFLTLIEGIYKSGNLLFNCRDDDMLLSLPISKAQIVGLRIFKFYVFELIYNSLFLIPAILAFAIVMSPGLAFYLVSIIMIFLLPIIPIALSSAIGAVTTSLSSRFKKHNLVQIVLIFIFMLGVMFLSFKSRNLFDNIGIYSGGINDAITKIYYPAKVFVDLIHQFDFGQLLVFIGINIAIILLVIAFISKIYFKVNSRVKSVLTSTSHEKIEFTKKAQSPFFALVKKELNRFFSSPVFVTNSGFGLILFLIGVGVICFKFNDFAGSLVNNEEATISLEQIQQFLPSVTFALMAFCSLMTFMTAVMVSLEGKAINLTKTLPVSARKILFAKVGASLLIIWPPILVGIIVMIIRFQFGILESLLLLIAGVVLPLIAELFGIVVNLKHPKFDAENDTEVVKQSTSIMISTFFGMGASGVIIGIGAMLVFTFGQLIGLAIVDTILVGAFGLFYLYFSRTCEKKFSQLQY